MERERAETLNPYALDRIRVAPASSGSLAAVSGNFVCAGRRQGDRWIVTRRVPQRSGWIQPTVWLVGQPAAFLFPPPTARHAGPLAARYGAAVLLAAWLQPGKLKEEHTNFLDPTTG